MARYQMTSHPNAFLNNPEVMKIVMEKQMEASTDYGGTWKSDQNAELPFPR